MTPIRVHCIKLRALQKVLNADSRLVVTEGKVEDALANPCDVLILELSRERKFMSRLRDCGPAASRKFSILAISDGAKAPMIAKAISAGADNYLDGETGEGVLINTVLQTARGESMITQEVAVQIKHLFHAGGPAAHARGALDFKREEILDHFAKGFSLQEVADTFQLTPVEIRKELRAIYSGMHSIPWRALNEGH